MGQRREKKNENQLMPERSSQAEEIIKRLYDRQIIWAHSTSIKTQLHWNYGNPIMFSHFHPHTIHITISFPQNACSFNSVTEPQFCRPIPVTVSQAMTKSLKLRLTLACLNHIWRIFHKWSHKALLKVVLL
ncbi:hypothetical protein CIPAW_03G053000 [Carya illinoinensis]|uniref:Uncharacterized protein n=1 Tax=Carya illinoinensis TaxID=32201 RepID=A0A8T1R0N8_CARIL|nr:hypothetical protein CIPAW_03G053000 [Carya illinoinensis]